MNGERNFAVSFKDRLVQNKLRVAGGLAAIASVAGVAAVACNAEPLQDSTSTPTTNARLIETPKIPTIDPVTLTIVPSQVATETPRLAVTSTPEATPNDFEVNEQRVNFGRQIDGRNYWEFLGNSKYRFEEKLKVYTTGQELTLRPLGPNIRVYLSQIDNATGEEVAEITSGDQFTKAVFPSGVIGSDELEKIIGYELGLNQNYRTQLGGMTFGKIDGPTDKLSFILAQKPLFCETGQDPNRAFKVQFTVSTGVRLDSGNAIFQGTMEPITVQDPFCVKPSA